MKSAIIIAAVLACSQVTTGSVPTSTVELSMSKQSHCSFNYVRGHRQGQGIHLSWATSTNAGVIGFDVESTYEDPTDPYAVWEVKGSVNSGNMRTFHFSDANILPGTMHYRVKARIADGSCVTSPIETVRFKSR